MLHRWRVAARSLERRRGLSSFVIATLALGIGANCAIFSAVDAVLLKPLPYPSPERLVAVYEHNAGLAQATQMLAPGRLEEWNEQNRTLDGLAGSYFENASDTSGPLPERIEAMRTSPRFFAVLGVVPAIGRWPTPDEERFGGPPVAVISDALWKRRFDASPAAVGRAMTLGGASRTIVGVMPASSALVTKAFADRFFAGANPIGRAIAAPLQQLPEAKIVGVVGDVRESGLQSFAEPVIYWCTYNPYWPDQRFLVRSDPRRPVSMSAIRAAMREIEPGRAVYDAQRLTDVLAGTIAQQRMNTTLLGLFAATAMILAAIGLYGMLSQLVSGRMREIGVRIALGARPAGIVASVAWQAMALAIAGAAVGLGAAVAIARFMASLMFGVSVHDPITFIMAPLLLALMAAAAAVLPARRAVRVDPTEVMRHV